LFIFSACPKKANHPPSLKSYGGTRKGARSLGPSAFPALLDPGLVRKNSPDFRQGQTVCAPVRSGSAMLGYGATGN